MQGVRRYSLCSLDSTDSFEMRYLDENIWLNNEVVWKRWQKEIEIIVKCILKQYVIGVKTALGYGIGSLN